MTPADFAVNTLNVTDVEIPWLSCNPHVGLLYCVTEGVVSVLVSSWDEIHRSLREICTVTFQ